VYEFESEGASCTLERLTPLSGTKQARHLAIVRFHRHW
jgi:hypothetical protein